jgi:uncharacterized protein YneF (UPF0154 family)
MMLVLIPLAFVMVRWIYVLSILGIIVTVWIARRFMMPSIEHAKYKSEMISNDLNERLISSMPSDQERQYGRGMNCTEYYIVENSEKLVLRTRECLA